MLSAGCWGSLGRCWFSWWLLVIWCSRFLVVYCCDSEFTGAFTAICVEGVTTWCLGGLWLWWFLVFGCCWFASLGVVIMYQFACGGWLTDLYLMPLSVGLL